VTTRGYLRRASWLPLVEATLDVDDATLRVADVADLPQLPGRDDGFRLELIGAANAVPSSIQRFHHATLGNFEMFVSPVEAVVGGAQLYQVVVDRSVGARGKRVHNASAARLHLLQGQAKIAS
jgi:uncharacterized protein DUF6916